MGQRTCISISSLVFSVRDFADGGRRKYLLEAPVLFPFAEAATVSLASAVASGEGLAFELEAPSFGRGCEFLPGRRLPLHGLGTEPGSCATRRAGGGGGVSTVDRARLAACDSIPRRRGWEQCSWLGHHAPDEAHRAQ